LSDVKQQTGNKSLNRIRKAIGLYLLYRSTTAGKFSTEMRQSRFNVTVEGGARVFGCGYIGAWDGGLLA
jgi:hypothetical protein